MASRGSVTSPFDPSGDVHEQRPLFEKMIAAAPVPADVVTTAGQLGGVPVIRVEVPGSTAVFGTEPGAVRPGS
jgi:hypothetical protein